MRKGQIKRNLSGFRFGKLKVISASELKKKDRFWLCLCDCGNAKEIRQTALLADDTKSCGCIKRNKIRNKSHLWTGYGEISGRYWHTITKRAKKHNSSEIITIEHAWNLFLKQDRKCALTGLTIFFANKTGEEQTTSLDRIDSSKGYIENNIQWLHKDVNKMKQEFLQDYFIGLCKIIADHKNRQN